MTHDVARLLLDLSGEIQRQIGILVGRGGSIEVVMVGDQKGITIPDISRYRTGVIRLRGLRFIHTHLYSEPVTEEDLTDLALLRLDMMVVLSPDGSGLPGLAQFANLVPDNHEGRVWEISSPAPFQRILDIEFGKWVQSLEEEFQRGQRSVVVRGVHEKAILLSVGKESRDQLENSMEELEALARSSGIHVAHKTIQRPQNLSPTTLIGKGKLKELLVKCMQLGVDLIIFDQNLTPG